MFKIDLEKNKGGRAGINASLWTGKKTDCVFDSYRAEMSVDRNEADEWSRGVSRSELCRKGKTELDLHIFQTSVPLKFLQVNIGRIIQTTFLPRLRRIS